MELPPNPEQYIAESEAKRSEIQNQLARLATQHEELLADELQIRFEMMRREHSQTEINQ